ncbi:MAG: lysophospholipid acyltransferase family protein [Chitinophagaceae bacterium]|nr:lysophospholipid acyltransferase family protein [Chitinophagaceae bacterium]
MYYLVYGLLYLISLLPFWIIYGLSDFVAFVLQYIVGYRKKVLMKNFSIAFPEKTEKEKKALMRRFYRNFTDTFLEAIKMFSMSEKTLRKRVRFDPTIFDQLYKEGKSCQIHLGHNFNWEWANLRVGGQLQQPFLGVYMPISNKIFDRLFKKLRQKSGTHLLSAKNMKNDMMPFRHQTYALVLVADQNPRKPAEAHWVKFFGRWTPFVPGPEKYARYNNMPVVFMRILRPKRGHYIIESKLATEHPTEMKEKELTLRYVRYLEEVIREHPEVYLWSHNRWRWEIKDEYEDKKIHDEDFVLS